MKVILMQDVKKIGKKFEVKEVSDGYARNFIVSNGLAKIATKEALEWLDMQKGIIQEKAEADLKAVQELASNLDGVEIPFPVKVGDEGQLFESITSQKVADRMKELGFQVKKAQVKLDDPIKELGEYPVRVVLDHNLEAQVTLIITEEEEG